MTYVASDLGLGCFPMFLLWDDEHAYVNRIFGLFDLLNWNKYPVSILRKSISGRHRPVRVADGPMTA